MPEFKPATTHKATATFINPKTAPFDYEVSLCMGVDEVEVSGASFRLSGGESRPVEFWVTMPVKIGTYPIIFKVSSGGRLVGSFAAGDVTTAAAVFTMPPTMESECECPYPDPVYWYCTFRCPITNRGNAPGTVTLTYWDSLGYLEPVTTEITIQLGETYIWERVQLVKFQVHPSPLVVYLQGNWEGDNLSEGRCYKCAPYEWPAGRSKVVATVNDGWYLWEDEEGNEFWSTGWEDATFIGTYIDITIDSSEEIPGFYNIGQDYIGKTPSPGYIDADGIGGGEYDMLPDIGKQITCILDCTGGNRDEIRWRVENVRYLREYPDSAYEFSYVETANVPGPLISYDYNWAISGNVSPFAIAYCRTATAHPCRRPEMLTGPATVRVWKSYGENIHPTAYAHPDPNKRFDSYTWVLNNWVMVARR